MNMAHCIFEGDLNNISERQLKFIDKIILELGYKNNNVLFEPVGSAGDNFAACVKRIIIKGENGDFNMIAKIAMANETYREIMNSTLLFRNEHIMYTEVLPKLVQLQKETRVPKEKLLNFAKCYGSLSEPPNEVILLEDLKSSNFTVLDRLKPISDECVRSVLKYFVVLHSLSFVLRYKEPDLFDKFKKSLCDLWATMAQSDTMRFMFQKFEEDTLKLLENQQHINIVKHKVYNTLNQSLMLFEANKDNKYTVIHHGDAWTNNILFKFKNGKLLESIMIDYQASKNSSPVVDIMYLILNCTDYETRKKNYNDWLNFYHSELERSLSDFNLNVEAVYPRSVFDADMKKYGEFMLGVSICFASATTKTSDDASKMVEAMNTDINTFKEHADEIGVSKLDDESASRFKSKTIDLVNSFIELELL